MAVYIDLEKALSLAKSLEPNFGFLSKPLIDAVQEIIRQASPEDVVPVIHAKWIEIWDKDHLVVLAYQCSECKTMRNKKTNYCADCGAIMDKGD